MFLTVLLSVLTYTGADAQRQRRGQGTVFASQIAEKKVVPPDSLLLARRDSIKRADSLFRADSAAMMKQSSLSAPVFSNGRDSTKLQILEDGSRIMHYYGDVSVKYQDMELKAERMDYDMNTGTVHAYGVYDSLTTEWIGRPVMTENGKVYNMEELRYNFNSRKARITNMVTTEDDGILHGHSIKMMPDKSINITSGKYTVCDADHPHYYLQLTAAKVVTEPSQKIVFGPAFVVIEDVKVYPLILPFGFVPKRPKRATGILFPTFGEETARGFYMRDLGMYFVFGDYLDLSATVDFFTLGSWAVDLNSRYKVNYKFNGTVAINYSDDRTGEKNSPDYMQSTNFGIRWSHSQDSKAHPGTTFSASVNFSSPKNNTYNSRNVNDALQNQASSSISYSKSFGGKANLSLNMLHSQNSRDESYAFTLPNMTFSVSTFYPFKKKNRVGKEKAYEKFSLAYSTSFQNKVNFYASDVKLDSLKGTADYLFNKMQNGMTHNFSIGLPSFTLFKYINLSPSISYGQNWFFKATESYYDQDSLKIITKTGNPFSHLGITQQYSGSLSASTRLYGMFQFGKFSKVQAIRHVVSPQVSMSFSPDLAKSFNGYRSFTYTDANGDEQTYKYNIYSGQMYSPPGSGRSATASFSVGNNLEAKVRDYADTTGSGFKKVKLIDQLSIRSGYNFLADSLKMNTVSMSMSTSIFGKVSISASANFDPYAVDSKGRRYNKLAINAGQGMLRFTNASASLSYSLSGKGEIKGNDGTPGGGPADYYQRMYVHPYTGEYIPGGWLYYTNPNVPWSVNFSYTFSDNKTWSYNNTTESLVVKNNITQTLRFSGNLKLTPKMNLNATSGYDFEAKQLTTTQLSATYDMHCFNISISWVPTGQWQSYSFRIQANAAALADLLRFKKSSSFWDR